MVRSHEVLDIGQRIALGMAKARHAACRQAHFHARVRSLIGRGVVAGSAVDQVGPGTAYQAVVPANAAQRVVPAKAAQRVAAGPPGQAVGVSRAVDLAVAFERYAAGGNKYEIRIVDIRPGSALNGERSAVPFDDGVRSGGRDGTEAPEVAGAYDHDPVGAVLEVDKRFAAELGSEHIPVRAVAASQDVGPAAAFQCIRAESAIKRVPAAVAGQDVAVIGAGQVLNANQSVGRRAVANRDRGVAANGGAVREIDCHRFPGSRIGSGINAGAAVDYIRARAANQNVVAVAAFQCIRAESAIKRVPAAVAGQDVAVIGAGQVLNANQSVGRRAVANRDRGVAANGGAVREIDCHRFPGSRIGSGINAGAAVDYIRARAANQNVVAVAAFKRVGDLIACQRVVARSAYQVFYFAQHVALGVPAAAPARVKGHPHRLGRPGVGCGINALPAAQQVRARAADQRVRPRGAFQRVVPGPAFEPVGAAIPCQAVVPRPAYQVFYSAQHVARGMPAKRVAVRAAARAKAHTHSQA